MKLFQRVFPAVLGAALLLSGCGGTETGGTTASTSPIVASVSIQESTAPAAAAEDTALSFAQAVELTLPEQIVRTHISDTRNYFYLDGAVIGGIEVLDIADQMDTMLLQEYVEQALAVTKAVYDTEYDYMGASDSYCAASVSLCDRDGREFYHYFYTGEQRGYDIWMDYSVLDTRDMISYLKTLHSADLYNPQDDTPANAQTPLLSLRAELPEGLTRQPTKTTRDLFYSGDTLAGGIEQMTDGLEPEELAQAAASLSQELYESSFTYVVAEQEEGILAQIETDALGVHLVHYILQVGEECYDVWGDTALIDPEQTLQIARSCQY